MNSKKSLIGVVCTFYNTNGGISSYVKGLEVEFRKINQSISIISPDIYTDKNISHINVASKGRVWVIIKTVKKLLELKPAEIHCHGTWYLLLSCLIYKWVSFFSLKDVPIAAVKHTEITKNRRSIKFKILSWIDRRCDCLVFVSNKFRESYLSVHENIGAIRTEVIWPGVNDILKEASSNNIYLKYKSEKNDFVITYMGLMEYQQKVDGLIMLLSAFSVICSRYSNMKLLIAGGGALEAQVDKKISDLGIKDCAIRVGLVENKADFYSISNLHCHISFKDIFPIVILEALACGVNVIANDIGDLRRLNIEGLRICDPEIDDIVDEIDSVMTNSEVVNSRYVMEVMGWSKCVEKFQKIF